MLVDLAATKLINNRSVVQLADYVNRKKSSLRFGDRSRDADFIIEVCAGALKKFNPSVRMVDCEVVYVENKDFIVMGVLYEGNLIKSYDSKAICNQFHLDNTMAIFAHPTNAYSRATTAKDMMIDIPNKLQYDPTYYDQAIFKDFIVDNSEGTLFNKLDPKAMARLLDLVHRSSYIVKDADDMIKDDIQVLEDMILQYGALLQGTRIGDYEVPEKYVISKTWFNKVEVNIGTNPYFIFRHVWRCYFRLCKEGYRFNVLIKPEGHN